MGDWEGKTAERTRGREKQGGQMTGVGEVGRGEEGRMPRRIRRFKEQGAREAGKSQRSNARGGMGREGQAEVRGKEEIETGEMGKTG